MSNDCRVEVLIDAIKELPDGSMKDALIDELKYAQDINGNTDPILQGIKRIIISGIRRELLSYERMNNAIEEHKRACQLNMRGTTRLNYVLAIVDRAKPFRWPLAVGFTALCLSPQATAIIDHIGKLLGR